MVVEPGDITELTAALKRAASMSDDEYILRGERGQSTLKTFLRPMEFYRESYATILNGACLRAAVPAVPYAKWIDTCWLARHAWPHLPNHKLPTLARTFRIAYKAHDALEDARVAGEVLALALRERQISIGELLATPANHITGFPKPASPRGAAGSLRVRRSSSTKPQAEDKREC